MSEVSTALRWACRRGMLELDILLGRFLEQRYLLLSPQQKKCFEQLLTCEDQDLFLWLTGKSQPEDPLLAAIVEEVRHHASST